MPLLKPPRPPEGFLEALQGLIDRFLKRLLDIREL
jgi:hypothetical protein